ncbi:unnamed protein product [Owenia fusiformis]|uniref:Uncharacterized protein n=1 Tax=Owenia fusiformis TaxID=6347 RepID=A0A8J1XUA3_OWEFU|nr:unnamed protein product [Owenia fusiformis]
MTTNIENSLISASALLKENKKRSLGIEKKRDSALNEENSNVAVQFAQCKADFKELKQKLIQLQTKFHFVKSLATDEETTIDEERLDEEIKDSKLDIAEAKGALEELKTKITACIETGEQEYTTCQNDLVSLEQLVTQVSAKKQKLDSLVAEREQALQSLGDLGSSNFINDISAMVESKKSEVKEYSEKLSQSKKALDELAKTKEDINAIIQEFDASTKEYMAVIGDREKEDKLMNNTKKEEDEFLSSVVGYLQHLSGLSIEHLHGDQLKVKFNQPEGKDETEALTLTMTFRSEPPSPCVLHKAEVNISTLIVDDIIERAIAQNDCKYLIQEVQQRWQKHFSLLHEITILRERYAIDWICNEGVLRMMLGDNGHIVCTLEIQDGYPATGEVKLKSISGRSEDSPGDLQPPQKSPTLTDWLHYLACRYNSSDEDTDS